MKTIELKVARIGNSRGVRLPAETLRRYRIGEVLLMEERLEGILLHPKPPVDDKLSWEETARQMSAAQEDWDEWDATVGDGMDGVLGAAGTVLGSIHAEPSTRPEDLPRSHVFSRRETSVIERGVWRTNKETGCREFGA